MVNFKFLSLFVFGVLMFSIGFSYFGEDLWYKLDGGYTSEVTNNTLIPSGSGYSFVSGKIDESWNIGGSAYAGKTSVSGFSSGNFDFSSSAWYKPSVQPSINLINIVAFFGSLGSTRDGFGLTYRDLAGVKKLYLYAFGEGSSAITQTLSTGTWYHIVFTYTASNRMVKMYLNGASIGNVTLSGDMAMNLNKISLGGINPGVSNTNGVIDDIRYYEHVLNQSLIDYLYNNGDGTSLSLSTMSTNIATESQGREAIEDGIRTALGAYTPIYTNQSIFITYSNGTQAHATFDKVAKTSTQTWAFNYITGSESYANMMNLTNILYAWEHANMTSTAIETSVTSHINSTKK